MMSERTAGRRSDFFDIHTCDREIIPGGYAVNELTITRTLVKIAFV